MRGYIASEWQIGAKWYVADVSDLANDSAAWWIPARLLNLSLEDYITLLTEKYNATIDKWYPDSNDGKSLLIFSWKNYSDAHKYKLDMNRIARNQKWTIQ